MSYTVRSGDSMSAIAARHNVSLQALISANPQVRNPSLIHPGQKLNIPGRQDDFVPASGSTYTVRSGDSMSAIAARHGISLQALIDANPQVRNPSLIHVGQKLNIPARSSAPAPAPSAPPANSTYTVKSGDTMSAIAARHGITLAALVAANRHITNASLIYPGQVLTIPGGRPSAPAPAPTPTPVTLRRGAQGPEVKWVQDQLVRHGFMTSAQVATGPGVFGPQTEAAVRAFQSAKGLPVDGSVGPQVRDALSGPVAPPLRRGAQGPEVKWLQDQLVRHGFMTNAQVATGPGIFGPQTEAAVRAFQSAKGLPVDGVVGPQTRAALAGAPAPVPSNPGQHQPKYDGTRPAEGVTRTDAWNAVDAPVQSKPGNRSVELYNDVINQFAVGVNPRYAKRNGNTYCNIFVWDVTRAMGAEIPHWWQGRELNANATNTWLNQHGPDHGWRKVSAEEAQAWANQGKPAVASWKNPNGIGHIGMVRPGQITSKGPALAQAGAKNFNNGHVADGFGRAQPEYWIHD